MLTDKCRGSYNDGGKDYVRQESFMDAAIERRKSDEEQAFCMVSKSLRWLLTSSKGKYSNHTGENPDITTRWSKLCAWRGTDGCHVCPDVVPWENTTSLMLNSSQGWKTWNWTWGVSDNPKLWNWPLLFKNVSAMKGKERLRNYSGLKRRDT